MQRSPRLSRPALAAAVVGAAAAAGLTATSMTSASSESGATKVKKQIICRAAMVSVVTPGTTAENYGTVSCTGRGFGTGVQHDTAQLTRPSETSAALSGRFRIFLDTGTLRGTYKATVTVADEVATYKGTMKVSSGTGTLKGTTGTGTIAGTSRDAAHSTLTERLALTVPVPKE